MHAPDINTPGGRAGLAFVAIVGGCITFTALIFIALWLLRESPGFVFWLAVMAHVQVLVGMTALGFLLGRRFVFSVSRDGASINDGGSV
jgi:hypothetical protein